MERIQINEVSIELLTAGDGPPLLFLHGGDYFAQHREFFDRLARHWRVVVPRHPGFGNSERPDGFRTVHDLAYLYLDLLERQDFGKVTLAGSSFGGWIALEMCVRCLERIDRLVLINSVGVKFGGREERDIADIYALPSEEVLRRSFFDPARMAPDYARLSDDELTAIARDRQATALYGWRPYMHDPGPSPMAAPGARAGLGDLGRKRRHRHTRLRPKALPVAARCPLRDDQPGRALPADRAA